MKKNYGTTNLYIAEIEKNRYNESNVSSYFLPHYMYWAC